MANGVGCIPVKWETSLRGLLGIVIINCCVWAFKYSDLTIRQYPARRTASIRDIFNENNDAVNTSILFLPFLFYTLGTLKSGYYVANARQVYELCRKIDCADESVCICMHACMHACMRARVCVCGCVWLRRGMRAKSEEERERESVCRAGQH